MTSLRVVIPFVLLACGPSAPPSKDAAPSMARCGDMPPQEALVDGERVVRVEVRSKLPSDTPLTALCVNHAGRRVVPEGGAAVRLTGLNNSGGGVIVFAVHAKKRSSSIRLHVHAFAEHHRNTAELTDSIEVVPTNLPDGTLRVTIELDPKDEKSLGASVVPACTTTPECAVEGLQRAGIKPGP